MIEHAHVNGSIHGVKVGCRSPPISHLFFADDTVIFSRTTQNEVEQMLHCITAYEQASGQQVNFEKTELTFSQNVPINNDPKTDGCKDC